LGVNDSEGQAAPRALRRRLSIPLSVYGESSDLVMIVPTPSPAALPKNPVESNVKNFPATVISTGPIALEKCPVPPEKFPAR